MEINTYRLALFEEILKYYTEEQLQEMCDDAKRMVSNPLRVLCLDDKPRLIHPCLPLYQCNIAYKNTKDPNIVEVLKNRYGPARLMWRKDFEKYVQMDTDAYNTQHCSGVVYK